MVEVEDVDVEDLEDDDMTLGVAIQTLEDLENAEAEGPNTKVAA